MKYNNIFITGSTGVVGKPLLRKIVKQGHNVFALSRSKNNNQLFSELGVTKIEGDLFSDSTYDNHSIVSWYRLFSSHTQSDLHNQSLILGSIRSQSNH